MRRLKSIPGNFANKSGVTTANSRDPNLDHLAQRLFQRSHACRRVFRTVCKLNSDFRQAMLYLCMGLFFCLTTITVLAQKNIVFDTDIGSDCDDAGALAILHKLADKGEVNILGVIFSSNKNKYGIGVCDAINTYYGRGDLPLGRYMGTPVGDSLNHYSKQIAVDLDTYHHDTVDSATELVTAYKNILETQPDNSVTILTVGHPHGLYFLMKDYTGLALIKQKVKEWIAMAYTGSSSIRDWNFGRNGAELYVEPLLKEWPKHVYLSGAGTNVITGNRKLPSTPSDNPVRKAYELWNHALTNGRSSWDQIAVLFAAKPWCFISDSAGSLMKNNKSETYWNADVDNPKHYRVTPKLTDAELAAMIEDLMSEPPAKKTR
jgi:hypothetical protein